jgi:AcrR family transcriptional regulator
MYSDTVVNMNGKRLTRRESQQVTRVKLIEAAEHVFVRTGFDAASVEQIAGEAGFSRGAFYSNFASKDELFLALLDKKRVETQHALDTVFVDHQDANERFRAARDWYADQWQQRTWTVLKTEFNLRALRKPPLRKRLGAIWRQEVEAYSSLLGQYFSDAGLKPRENQQTIAMSLLAAAQGLGMMSLFGLDPALQSTIAESRKLAFERLVPSPVGKAAKTKKRGNL